MKAQFSEFSSNIRLTDNQKEDARTKYRSVAKCLHKEYYDIAYDGSTKLLFGSYKTKTNTRPLSVDQDVDLLFRIPKETYDKFSDYDGNGQSALLQEIRTVLNKTFTTTEVVKGWGKVVLVQFAENRHNVEVLPAYELEDGTFHIPNTADGGSWEIFDPKGQVSEFQTSNSRTDSLTADLTRMMKTWVKNTPTVKSSYSSFQLLNDVMSFLESNYREGAEYDVYEKVCRDCFQYIKSVCPYSIESNVQTALDRSNKAIDYNDDDKPKEASEEWRKIFGSEFPLVKENPQKESAARVFTAPSAPYGTN